ncbi:protein FAM107B [Echeneis naucrates]|uniref:protein FAM107B n=1 Tax=Echeneis naucrates TaxID=173247 RepID=UPI0011141E28|nr:protein FAM107B-like [Echeneis naucrates]
MLRHGKAKHEGMQENTDRDPSYFVNVNAQSGHRGAFLPHQSDNGVNAEACLGHSNPIRSLRTHNELHKELLLAHKRGLVLNSRSELQQVLERRKRVQSDHKEDGESRSPLEDVLLRRQQKQLEKEKEQEERLQQEAQLMEFVRVRQNLRKIHSVMQNKVAHL